MGVHSYNHELTCPISPSRMFKALFLDNDLVPKLMPQHIKSVDVLHGDGGAGTIKQLNFSESSHLKYVKHKIDVLDKESFYCKYTLFEGDALRGGLESIVYEVKFEASGNGGCTIKMTSHYHAKEGVETKEDEIKAGKDKAMALYKAIETYLTENPDVHA